MQLLQNPFGRRVWRWEWSRRVDPVSVRGYARGTAAEASRVAQDVAPSIMSGREAHARVLVIKLLDHRGDVVGRVYADGSVR